MKRRLGDRRERPRFEIVGELWGTLDTVIGMPVVDIGRGGALVQSPVPLTPQSVHHVAVDCDGQQASLTVQVRHVRAADASEGQDGFLIGLEFLSVPPAFLARIDALMGGSPGGIVEGV